MDPSLPMPLLATVPVLSLEELSQGPLCSGPGLFRLLLPVSHLNSWCVQGGLVLFKAQNLMHLLSQRSPQMKKAPQVTWHQDIRLKLVPKQRSSGWGTIWEPEHG